MQTKIYIAAPPKSGKSTILNLLKYFVSPIPTVNEEWINSSEELKEDLENFSNKAEDRKKYFQNFQISNHSDIGNTHMGQHPVLYFNLTFISNVLTHQLRRVDFDKPDPKKLRNLFSEAMVYLVKSAYSHFGNEREWAKLGKKYSLDEESCPKDSQNYEKLLELLNSEITNEKTPVVYIKNLLECILKVYKDTLGCLSVYVLVDNFDSLIINMFTEFYTEENTEQFKNIVELYLEGLHSLIDSFQNIPNSKI